MFPEVNRNKNIGEKGVNMNSQVFRQYLAQMSFNQELVYVQSCHCQIAHLQGCLLMHNPPACVGLGPCHVCADVCTGNVQAHCLQE